MHAGIQLDAHCFCPKKYVKYPKNWLSRISRGSAVQESAEERRSLTSDPGRADLRAFFPSKASKPEHGGIYNRPVLSSASGKARAIIPSCSLQICPPCSCKI